MCIYRDTYIYNYQYLFTLTEKVLNLICFPGGSVVKNSSAMQELKETWVRSLGQEDPLEEGMAIHSSILAWRIPWTEESGGLWNGPWRHKESDIT